MHSISLVIPVKNEEDSIIPLVERIHNALRFITSDYEIIFIDDHSTDRTYELISSLKDLYPVWLYSKVGKPGKAQSLLEGFKKAKNELICMIDADLEYPPEAISSMMEKIDEGSDIVLAERTYEKQSFHRKLLSNGFRFIFANMLHDLRFDVQSGLKLFRKEIIERVKINPTQWTFDLEFLLKAKDAGYTISAIPIKFQKRSFGSSKLNPLKATYEIGMNALSMKFKPAEIFPFHHNTVEKEGKGFHYKGKKFISFTSLRSSESAFFRFSRGQIHILLIFFLLVVIGMIKDWHTTIMILFGSLTFLYFLDLFFNLFLIVNNFRRTKRIQELIAHKNIYPEREWPMYTVLCPLYKEWKVIPQFVKAMQHLDYPKHKLQVLLLLEEDDKQTLQEVQKIFLPEYFSIVVVPDSQPKTKPKACNYGLLHATGKYSVIFDAEDVPEPAQLKEAVVAFENADEKTVCIQAKLNFYNPHHNLLTRIFTAEYCLWFDLILTGMQTVDAPIPLGGTSNHFPTQVLRNLDGWDAFNVTEDCDLGMRLVKHGYKTAIIDSITHEEANSDFGNWLGQRTRWIKGYIQTYFVHMRNPNKFIKKANALQFWMFQLIVGGKILSLFINPMLWAITIIYFALRAKYGTLIESFFPAPILYTGVFCCIVGNFLYFYYYMIACAKRGYFEVIPYAFFIPIYWLMMSVATWMAVYNMIVRPHHWFKTKHGLHIDTNNQPLFPINPSVQGA